jgi:hypothetical protein
MTDRESGALLQVLACDEPKLQVAKLKANCGRLNRARPQDFKKKLRDIEYEIAMLMQQVAASPEFHDDLLTTRVTAEIHWQVPASVIQDMFAMPVNTEEFDATVIRNGGDMVELVPTQIKAWGYECEPPTLEERSFIVGSVCTHARAGRLCQLLYMTYPDQIRTREITVRRGFYGYHFPDLLTNTDAEAYIRQKGLVSRAV